MTPTGGYLGDKVRHDQLNGTLGGRMMAVSLEQVSYAGGALGEERLTMVGK